MIGGEETTVSLTTRNVYVLPLTSLSLRYQQGLLKSVGPQPCLKIIIAWLRAELLKLLRMIQQEAELVLSRVLDDSLGWFRADTLLISL